MKDIPFDPYDFFGYLATGLLVLFGLQQVIGIPEIAGKDLKTLDMVVVVLAAYVVGQLTATPASAFLERLLVRDVLRAPSVNLMREKSGFLRNVIFPGYYEPLPPGVRAKILLRAAAESEKAVEGEELFLHIRFKDYMKNDAVLKGRLDAFLNKYGFARNLCFACLVAGAALLVFKPFDLNTTMTRYGLLGVGLGVLLFYRYLKFYRQHTYELFNVYAGRDMPAKPAAASTTP